MSHTEKTSAVDAANLSLDAPLDELLDVARSHYDVVFEPVKIGDISLDVLQLADLSTYIDQITAEIEPDTPLELPFWAKLWRTSFLLSYYVQRLPTENKTMLEIGAGIGLCGLFAAACGMEVVISDIHPDALLFARISILKNGLEDRAGVARVDFTTDRLKRTFDYVLGSEVLYKEDHYRGLVKFLLAHLSTRPDAEAILAKEYSRKASRFFSLAHGEFNIRQSDIGFKSVEDSPAGTSQKHLCTIYRLSPKKHD